MKLLLILAVFVGTALAQEICCVPEEFEISEAIISSNDRGGKFETYVERRRRAYDYPRRRTAFDAEVDYLNGTRSFFKIIENYEEGSFWFIENEKCSKQSLRSREPRRCEVNETLIRSFYTGAEQLSIDEWGEKIEREGERGFELRSYVRGSCIPFSISFVGEEERGGVKVKFTRAGQYEDFIKGVRDPERFFGLPSFCPK